MVLFAGNTVWSISERIRVIRVMQIDVTTFELFLCSLYDSVFTTMKSIWQDGLFVSQTAHLCNRVKSVIFTRNSTCVQSHISLSHGRQILLMICVRRFLVTPALIHWRFGEQVLCRTQSCHSNDNIALETTVAPVIKWWICSVFVRGTATVKGQSAAVRGRPVVVG